MMQLIIYIEKSLARAREQFLCGSKKENVFITQFIFLQFDFIQQKLPNLLIST